ncbi:hypothetical protein ACFSTC_08900 [Nonomuraea ferruginea]
MDDELAARHGQALTLLAADRLHGRAERGQGREFEGPDIGRRVAAPVFRVVTHMAAPDVQQFFVVVLDF